MRQCREGEGLYEGDGKCKHSQLGFYSLVWLMAVIVGRLTKGERENRQKYHARLSRLSSVKCDV